MISRLAVPAYLTLICMQFGIIMNFMIWSQQQKTQIATLQEEVTDWEQISDNYKQSAKRFALSSERCLQTVRVYQSSMFQPAEIGK